MSNSKDIKKRKNAKNSKAIIKPGDIKGKIEVSDTRERKNGPGGN